MSMSDSIKVVGVDESVVEVCRHFNIKGDAVSGENGEIIEFDKEKGLRIKTSDGSIYITVAQFPNSRRMTIDEYLRGHSIEFGTILI